MPSNVLQFKDAAAEGFNKGMALAYGEYLRRGRGIMLVKVYADHSDFRYITQDDSEFSRLTENLDADAVIKAIEGYDPFEEVLCIWENHSPLVTKATCEAGALALLKPHRKSHLSPVIAYQEVGGEVFGDGISDAIDVQ